MPAKKNEACRYCGSRELTKFLCLGEHPPSNSFIPESGIPAEVRYPLDVYWCSSCYLVQLLDVVPAEVIFDDYHYLSSSSKALRNHYAELTGTASERFALRPGDTVVDIGCNDGIMLNAYAMEGLRKVGVEPSRVAEIAAESGLEVVRAFFGTDPAREIVDRCGKARIVTATNVFAHVDDIGAFTDGLPILLADDGVFIMEAAYLVDMIDQTLFDTVYHEHLCYLALTPMVPFLARHGLEVFDAERVPFGASGPAIRVYARKQNGRQDVCASVGEILEAEKAWGVGDPGTYAGYAKQVEGIKHSAMDLLDGLKKSGATIGGYGAPAKGNTLLNYFGITSDLVEYIAETNPIKQGLVTPGAHIPIVSEEEFLDKMPEYALLLTWNYLDFFLEKSGYIRKGGRFVVPLPHPTVVPAVVSKGE